MRILLFEDDRDTRTLFCIFLRGKGFEVHEFASPATCALVSADRCKCPGEFACADIIITDMRMTSMNGLELVRHQLEMGCQVPSANKAVLSAALTPEQEDEFRALGCRLLRKPIKLNTLLDWIRDCEKNIPAGRKLLPLEKLQERETDTA
ncbi:hypothetical protein JCM30471_30130 [Desulfuromonas carbonis]|uniref:response regulator n=1 Tax=Desulfuromonas sp. DDH964 TaxID=1823759 RepID=UPI00078D1C88|nr:response regulator [Desulfuromonas sp. DDH964]AMV71175.1 response regulator [Desulfuromonas sp. DDH964]